MVYINYVPTFFTIFDVQFFNTFIKIKVTLLSPKSTNYSHHSTFRNYLIFTQFITLINKLLK